MLDILDKWCTPRERTCRYCKLTDRGPTGSTRAPCTMQQSCLRHRPSPVAPGGGTLSPALAAPPAGAALSGHQVVRRQPVAVSAARGRGNRNLLPNDSPCKRKRAPLPRFRRRSRAKQRHKRAAVTALPDATGRWAGSLTMEARDRSIAPRTGRLRYVDSSPARRNRTTPNRNGIIHGTAGIPAIKAGRKYHGVELAVRSG